MLPVLPCLALLLIFFLRRPEMFLTPQFWAEDGPVIFVQADVTGARALLLPYGGYHHLLLRMIAALAAPLDAVVLPAGYFFASMAVTIALAAAVFSPRLDLSYRPACALTLGLVPHTGEVFGNLTNLQWPAALGLVWLLLARDATRPGQQIRDSLLAVVLGLTGVFSVLFAPLFLYRAWQRRSSAAWLIAGLILCTALVQVTTICRTGGSVSPAGASWSLPLILNTIGLRLGGALCLPMNQAMHLPPAVAVSLGLVCLVLLLAAAGWPGPQRETRRLLAACLGLILAGTLFRLRQDLGDLHVITNGDRYFFLPKLLAAWLIIQGLANPGWRRWACAGVCTALLLTSLVDWRYERLHDFNWAVYARRIEAGESVPAIPLNPDGWTFSHPGRHR